MGGRAAEQWTPFGVHVGEGAGVNEYFLLADGDDERECVGVAMAGGTRAEGAPVEESKDGATAEDNKALFVDGIDEGFRVSCGSLFGCRYTAFGAKPPLSNLRHIV